ncbi:hypothetical protein F4813DRAFT_373643 [Daldinia decipiens]|uniref:uncharacterized protein n=1 Tax=Daldinia decipiens TaxID=326647 RepID=UPI0020C4E17A|nr:uncharacterized protein F4813DRAFT_373643 [Daldinia decipiens]KAI1653657.1 hypothetical protein F4813DRAFT_373643 [Daldinia decipiens]
MLLCLSCHEMIAVKDLAEAPCRHTYCRGCLERIFRHAMTDEAFFPPRCCRQPIPVDPNQLFLPVDLVWDFREKEVEFSTPNRTYCHQSTCSAFIKHDAYVGNVATCSKCQSTTCVTCKGPSHDGNCPPNEGLQEVLQLARDEGWQRCPNCLSMIELNAGCNHIM